MLTDRQTELYELMSDISEDCWCAGWMSGNEFSLWCLVSNPSASRQYGQRAICERDRSRLAALAKEIGGWVYWHDDEYEPTLPRAEWGPRFIAMDAWPARYERRMTPDA